MSGPMVTWLYAAMLAVAIAYLVHYLCLAFRHARRIGLSEYVRWTLAPDVRVYVVAAFFSLHVWQLIYADTANYWLAVTAPLFPAVALLRGLCGPQILLLHTFDPRNGAFSKWLVQLAPSANIISLFPGRIEKSRWSDQFGDLMLGIGSRFSTDAHWREMVHRYIRWSDVIVVNLSFGRQGLYEELSFLSQQPEVLPRTVFIASVDAPPEAVEICRRLFPDAPIWDRDARTVLGPCLSLSSLSDPLNQAILSKLRTHFVTPLVGPVRLPPPLERRENHFHRGYTTESIKGDRRVDEAEVSNARLGVLIFCAAVVCLVVMPMTIGMIMMLFAEVLAKSGMGVSPEIRYQTFAGPIATPEGWHWIGFGSIGSFIHITWRVFCVIVSMLPFLGLLTLAEAIADDLDSKAPASPDPISPPRAKRYRTGAVTTICILIAVLIVPAVGVWLCSTPALFWSKPTWVLGTDGLTPPDGHRIGWDEIDTIELKHETPESNNPKAPRFHVVILSSTGMRVHDASPDLCLLERGEKLESFNEDELPALKKQNLDAWRSALNRFAPRAELNLSQQLVTVDGKVSQREQVKLHKRALEKAH